MSRIDLSIVVEMDTKDITGACDFEANLREWGRQVRAVAPRRAEIILCSPAPLAPPASDLSCPVRVLTLPGTHYYGLKNAGANAAQGRIVFFTDSDCRPGENYLANLFRVFADPKVGCAAGRTYYDGAGLLSRLNTVFSFGRFHYESLYSVLVPLSHNVAVRRNCYDQDPFGPYAGRVRGDVHLSESMRRRGSPPVFRRALVIYHEDMTFTLRGTLERHLREHFVVSGKANRARRWPVLRRVLGSPWRRLQKVRLFGRSVGIRRRHLPVALAVIGAYAVLDAIVVGLVLTVPSWRRSWLAFQFGESEAQRLD